MSQGAEEKPELEPPRRQGVFEWSSFLVGLLVMTVISTVALTLYAVRSPAAEQPIAFNHRLHVDDTGLECLDCHEFYERETFSGLPTAEVCGICHEEAQGESREEARLVEMIQEGRPLDWQPLFSQPPHVFYSHRRHVVVAGIECETCHGTFAQSESPPSRVVTLTMEDCIACHQERGAAEDCTACHR